MTDRELLGLAAKAAGIELGECACGGNACSGVWDKSTNLEWSPLADDGQALRLAVKLGIDVLIVVGANTTTFGDSMKNEPRFEERHNNDPYAATRRAIVRAAAEIGKDMK